MPAICPLCVTSSLAYEKWYGSKPSLQHLQSFDTVGYARKGTRAHKLKPRGERCVMLGIVYNHPRDKAKVLVVQAEQIMNRRNISWYRETAPDGLISSTTAG